MSDNPYRAPDFDSHSSRFVPGSVKRDAGDESSTRASGDHRRGGRKIITVSLVALLLIGAAAVARQSIRTSVLAADQAPNDSVAMIGGMPLERRPGAGDEKPGNPLIDALLRHWEDLGDIEGHRADKARDELRQAADYLSRIKAQNREAIRQVNRQPRINRCDVNVVLFVLDDVGYGDLGCYGQQKAKTPRIDQLAAQGVRFTQYYAGSATGVPSRGSLLSGNDTSQGRAVGDDWITVRDRDFTLAESMYESGYTTALAGRWGVGNLEAAGTPNSQGFQHAFGYLDRAGAEIRYPDHLWRNGSRVPYPGNAAGGKEHYSSDLVTEEATEFLRRAGSINRPFFLMVPYSIARANKTQFDAGGPGLEVPSEAPYEDENWTADQKRRAAMLTRVDRQIGEIVDLLEERRLLRKTLILVTSDNGPSSEAGGDVDFFDSNGPLKGEKNSLDEGGIRVPMIVRPPASRFAGNRNPRAEAALTGVVSDQVWAAWDVPPTLADYVGAWHYPRHTTGRAIADVLHGEAIRRHEYLYWELHKDTVHQAVRMGDWKAVRRGPDAAWQLYDLAADLGETRDIATDHPAVLDKVGQIVAGIESQR